MSKGFYLVTKPLQYFNVTNIADEVTHRICLIVDLFYNAEEFYANIKKQEYWNEVHFFRTSAEAYRWLKDTLCSADLLYIDSDYGLKKTIWLSKIKTSNIFVYEEGVGTYRDDLIKCNNSISLIKFLIRLIGIKEHMGGGKYTKGIIIYDLVKHMKMVSSYKKVRILFKNDFMSHVPSVKHHFNYQLQERRVFLDSLEDKNVLLYLTSWEYNTGIETIMKKFPNYVKIIKPHPHIKTKYTQSNFDIVLNNDVFIELYIVDLLARCNELVVIHENSGTMQYIVAENLKALCI